MPKYSSAGLSGSELVRQAVAGQPEGVYVAVQDTQKRLRGTNPSSQERLTRASWGFWSPVMTNCVTDDFWMLLVCRAGQDTQLFFQMCL